MVELAAGIFVGLFALFTGMFLFAMFAWVLGGILEAVGILCSMLSRVLAAIGVPISDSTPKPR